MMVKAKMTREQIHVSRLGEVNGIGVNIKKRIAIKWKVKAGEWECWMWMARTSWAIPGSSD